MIRPSYQELVERIFIHNDKFTLPNEANPHTILLGNPGTGKTMFGYYLMHVLMQQEIGFAYEPNKDIALVYNKGKNI